jgi:hypothetical protein
MTWLELYWKADQPAVGALAFWEDTLRYLFLPRLKTRRVLAQAIVKGAASRDFFGTAYGQADGQHEGKYDGFKLGDANVQVDDTLLLIELEAAKQYEAAQAAPPTSDPITGISYPPTTGGPGTPTVAERPTLKPPETGSVSPRMHTFIGTADVNAATAKVRLVQIADEVINLLAGDPQATVKVTVEIAADFPGGVSDQVKRAVSENAASLGFKNRTWE